MAEEITQDELETTDPEEGKELTLETEEETKEETPEETPSDPLDGITDVEELRKRAKGFRSERNRLKEPEAPKPETPKEPPKVEPESEFLSKKDFYKSNERKAITELTKGLEADSDEVKSHKAYITENWDKISTLYTPRMGKDTPEDILEDLSDAVTLYISKNQPKADDGASALSETSGGGGGSFAPSTEEKKEPPRFKEAVQPEEWYKLSPKSEERLKKKGIL